MYTYTQTSFLVYFRRFERQDHAYATSMRSISAYLLIPSTSVNVRIPEPVFIESGKCIVALSQSQRRKL
jgi:hypothetical protein